MTVVKVKQKDGSYIYITPDGKNAPAFLTGTGHEGNLKGDGNADIYIRFYNISRNTLAQRKVIT